MLSKRLRLRYAYQILRGRNLKTKETTPGTRAENFEKFGQALELVLGLNNWNVPEPGVILRQMHASTSAKF